ncbi:MAG: hypothetical protein MJ109_00440 [Kiritimatiellae bacterium]|nr:hypothetical protein [Kiritimatiellia bacterium]
MAKKAKISRNKQRVVPRKEKETLQMCKKVSPIMALGFALQKRDRISYDQLLLKSQKLLSTDDGYLLDVSFREIAKTVEAYPGAFEIVVDRECYSVIKKRTDVRMFKESHLKMCYHEAFSEAEFKELVSILIEA